MFTTLKTFLNPFMYIFKDFFKVAETFLFSSFQRQIIIFFKMYIPLKDIKWWMPYLSIASASVGNNRQN